jgi:hypothetical protein
MLSKTILEKLYQILCCKRMVIARSFGNERKSGSEQKL